MSDKSKRPNKFTPRGIRNNNPLNIVHSKSAWVGRSEVQEDSRFVQFAAMVYGIRAAYLLIRTYVQKHRCDTIEKVICRWCPDKTARAYIESVCNWIGEDKSTPIRIADKDFMCRFVAAMARVETGIEATDFSPLLKLSDFADAYDMAFGTKKIKPT